MSKNCCKQFFTIVFRALADTCFMVYCQYFFLRIPTPLLITSLICIGFWCITPVFSQPCPTLSQSSTLTSSDCAPGFTPCTLCPGDMFTLNTTGTGLQPGTCIDWYYGTSAGFNPYAGQGILLGCSPVEVAPPSGCTSCPLTLALYVNACGTEANNEIVAMWSGSGFAVDDLTIDFADAVDDGAGNFDIGGGCGWQEPSAGAIASIQSICTGATIVGAGPGEVVPSGVPVIIFTSAGYDFNYNFGSLCPFSPVIYVMQNGCTRALDAFPNSGGSVSTNISLSCGCNDNTTYNPGSLTGGDGAFVTDAGFFFPIYGNASCGFPNLPGGGGGGGTSPFTIPPFDVTITDAMCNGGPYWVKGIINPLPPGCPQTTTNALQFNVPCPNPVLQPGPDMCSSAALFSLTTLADPTVPNGTWSGPGVSGTNFNPAGLSGPVTLTFTPSGPCGTEATTTINVFESPVAVIDPVSNLCAGQSASLDLSFTGEAPFTFNLTANGSPAGAFTVNGNNISIPVTPAPPSVTYTVTNLSDANCAGLPVSVTVTVSAPATAVLSLSGPNVVCSGDEATFSVNFTGGNAPFVFTPVLNGVPQSEQTSNVEPVVFSLPVNIGNNTITITNASAGDCPAPSSGTVNVTGVATPTATLVNSPNTLCQGTSDVIQVQVTGTGSFSLVYAINGANQAPVTVSAPQANITVPVGIGTNEFTLVSLTGGVCPGTVDGDDITTVQPIPTASLSGGTALCSAVPVTLTIDYTPDNVPATIQYTANGVPQTALLAGSSPFDFVVNPLTSTVYTLTNISTGMCSSALNSSATVSFSASGTATLSLNGPNAVCTGQNAALLVDFSEFVAPFVFTPVLNGVPQAEQVANNEPVSFSLPVTTGTNTFTITNAASGDCPATTSGTVNVTGLVAPTAQLVSSKKTICQGQNDTIQVLVTGAGPFSLTYALNGVAQPPVTVAAPQALIPVPANAGQNIFTLSGLTGGPCPGTVSGRDTTIVEVAPTATLTGTTSTCQAGGTVPLTLNINPNVSATVQVSANGAPQVPLLVGSSPFVWNVNPAVTTTYTLTGISTGVCTNTLNSSATVTISTSGTAILSLNGPGSVCTGQNAELMVDFSVVAAPFSFTPIVNGVPQAAQIANNEPVMFSVPVAIGPNNIAISNASAGNCAAVASGLANVTGLNAPTGQLVSSPKTICQGQSDTIQVLLTGTGNLTLSYALNGVAQPPVTVTAPQALIPVASGVGQNIYTLISLTDAVCTGIVSGTDTTIVQAAPNAALSGSVSLCQAGATVPLTINYSPGNIPATIQYTANGVPQTAINATTSPFVLNVTPSATTVYALTSIVAAGCSNTASATATVTVGAGPTAVISGNNNLCLNGGGDSITVNLAGGGPYTFVYSINGAPQPPITTNLSEIKIYVNPSGYTRYELVSVSNPFCAGTVSGLAEIFVFVNSNANLPADLTFCNGVSTTILVNVTGTAPFTLFYAINGVEQPPVTTDEGPIPILANITQTTVYKLINIQSPGCNEVLTDSMIITINYPPTIANLVRNCDPVAGTYTVEFDIVGGTAPYTLTAGSGTFTNNHFVSSPIPQANDYAFSFNDANNCGTVEVNGVSTCNCTSNAGTMNTTPLLLCAGETATAAHNGNQTLDNDDILAFILHDQPSLPVGQILAWSATSAFNWNPAWQTGTTYYISAIAGNGQPNGEVALTDICLSVAVGTPVTWRPLPTATLPISDVNVCAGQPHQIPVEMTGTGPFTLNFIQNGVPGSVGPVNNDTLFIPGTATTQPWVVELTGVTDAFCANTLDSTISVITHAAPQAGAVSILCDFANNTYTLSFTVTAANLNEVIVQGVNGTLNPQTGMFTSLPIPKTDNYNIVVKDQWACDSVVLSGMAICDCTTNAGVLPTQNISVCAGQNVSFDGANGIVLANGDVLRYFLVTNPVPPFTNIVAQSTTPSFLFFPGQTIPGTTYYAVAVVGPALGTGIDLIHPCTRFSNAIPVMWRAIPTATMTGPTNICRGEPVFLQINLTGGDDYAYTINGFNFSQTVQNDTSQVNFIPVTPLQTTNYSITGLSANGCSGVSLGGLTTIQVRPVPEIVDFEQICAPDRLSFVLTFRVSNGPANNTTYTVSGITGTFQDTVFTSDPIPANSSYGITVSSPTGCSSSLAGFGTCECQTDAGSITPGVSDVCVTGTVTVTHGGDQVLESGDGLYYILCSDPAILPAGLLAVNDIPQFSFIPGMAEDFTYYVVAVAGTVLPNGDINFANLCLDYSNSIPVVFHTPPQAELGLADTLLCQGESFFMPVQLVGNPPFSLTYSINGAVLPPVTTSLNNFTISSSNIQEDQLFLLTGISDAYCAGTVTGMANIRIQPSPAIVLLGGDTICPGGVATLTLQLENADSAQVEIVTSTGLSLSFNNVKNGFTFEVTPSVTTTYSFGNVVFWDNDCPGKVSGTALITVEPLVITTDISDFNGFGVTCPGYNDGSALVTISGGSEQYSWVWSNGETGLALSNLSAGSYTVTITDASGCTLVETVEISAPEPIDFTLETQDPPCYDTNSGAIILDGLSGGAGEYTITVNGLPQTATPPLVLENLPAGAYEVVVTDKNGCSGEQDASLANPPELLVDLGDDIMLALGDSVQLTAQVNVDLLEKVTWSTSSFFTRVDSLVAVIRPLYALVYSVTVTDTAGCTATDDILVSVRRDNLVYVPNTFSPQSNDGNNTLTVFAGNEVVQVRSMQIFDRWGDLLFEQRNFVPNNPANGWNGRARNRFVQPGVYVYRMEIERIDGTTTVIHGDVTVVR